MSKPVNGRPALSDEVKKRLKPLIIELRRTLEEDLERELRRLGLDGSKDRPVPVEMLSYLTDQEREIRAELEAILSKEQESIGSFAGALEAVRREAAYTHLNRLVGLKCLELRSHLVIEGERTEVVTCRAEFGGRSKWLWTLRSRDSRYRHGAQAEELLWREGLLQACAAVTQEIGVLFDPADPYAKVWPSFRTLRAVVDRLNELPEDAFHTDELLGWVYQYFKTEEKEKVTAGESFTQKLKKTKKITGTDIATYTALYTERYMVDFLLQNSIGAYWMEMYPDSRAKEAWQYYVTPATPHTRLPKPLKEWKLLDPAMGSGHFLVVAFDLLAQLYEEERQMEAQGRLPRGWSVPAGQTARVILENNLHGIDIDLRAVQLAALALYLKAKELGWDEAGGPPRLNLVVADAVLTRGEAYERLLAQYKDEPAIQEAIRVIWHSLEHVRELGSLVRVEEEVEDAIRKIKAKEERDIPLISSARDWEGYKKILFQRLNEVFESENRNGNLTGRIFSLEGQKSVGLLEVLAQRYDVVYTNPPYMGSKNMGENLKKFVASNYKPGKRDLYAAFILRCQKLTKNDGYVSMVTQQSWMFLKSFADLRSLLDNGDKDSKNIAFSGVLNQTTLSLLAHLGEGAFSDPAAAGAFVALFTLRNSIPINNHIITAIRLIREKTPEEKIAGLLLAAKNPKRGLVYYVYNRQIIKLPRSSVLYWLPSSVFRLIDENHYLGLYLRSVNGSRTGDNNHYLRYFWEIKDKGRWLTYAKGGPPSRWDGNDEWCIDWSEEALNHYQNSKIGRWTEEKFWNLPGISYTKTCRGRLTVRYVSHGISDYAGPTFVTEPPHYLKAMLALINTHYAAYMSYSFNPTRSIEIGDIFSVPISTLTDGQISTLSNLANLGLIYKRRLLEFELTSRCFVRVASSEENVTNLLDLYRKTETEKLLLSLACVLVHSYIEKFVESTLSLDWSDLNNAGLPIPVGWLPLIINYSDLPEQLLSLKDYHEKLSKIEITSFGKNRLDSLRSLYASEIISEPIIEDTDEDVNENTEGEEYDEDGNLDVIPLPIIETFLDHLSTRMRINPISVYLMLTEIKHNNKNLVCPSEYLRFTEDYFSVLILKMLGYRWPNEDQYEQGQGKGLTNQPRIVEDAIIQITPFTGIETIGERINRYFDEVFGVERGHLIEREAGMVLGWKQGIIWGKQKPLPLEKWFEQEFFKRHVSQFKKCMIH